jgi:hypothetical protein
MYTMVDGRVQKKSEFHIRFSPLMNWQHIQGRSIIGAVGREDLSNLPSVPYSTTQDAS